MVSLHFAYVPVIVGGHTMVPNRRVRILQADKARKLMDAARKMPGGGGPGGKANALSTTVHLLFLHAYRIGSKSYPYCWRYGRHCRWSVFLLSV